MPWLIPMAIALGAGVGKHFAIDKPAADRKRALAATTERFSPWTGLHGQPVDEPNLAGTALGFAANGAALGQGIDNMSSDQAYKDALTKRINSGGSPIGYGPTIGTGGELASNPFWGQKSYGSASGSRSSPWSLGGRRNL